MRYWTVKDVAERFNRSERTVRRWIHAGKISARISPGGRGFLIPDTVIRTIVVESDVPQADISGHKDVSNR